MTKVGLNVTNLRLRIVFHEIMHTFNRIHEHERFDRDNYIQFKNQITYFKDKKDTSHGIPYDYQSVMHYYDGFTAWPDLRFTTRIGNYIEPTFSDIKWVNYHLCRNHVKYFSSSYFVI